MSTPDATPQRVATWPLLLLALPAFVAVWSGWVGLGGLTGFGVVHPLPGIADKFAINTAITLPIGVETYAAYALRAWLADGVPTRARVFARWSALGSLALGAGGQVAYHLMEAQGMKSAPWWITTMVACLPVAVLGMGAALAHLLRSTPAADADETQQAAAPRAQRSATEPEDAAPAATEPLVTLQPVMVRDGHLEVPAAPAADEVEAEPAARHHAAPEVQQESAAVADLDARRLAEVPDAAVAVVAQELAQRQGCSTADLSRRAISAAVADQFPGAPKVGDRRVKKIIEGMRAA